MTSGRASRQSGLRISLGVKIFSIATSLLLLLIFVAYISSARLHGVKAQVSQLNDYLIPVSNQITDVRVQTLNQEVHIERIGRLYADRILNKDAIDNELITIETIRQSGRESLTSASLLTDEAIDELEDDSQRQQFTRLQPRLADLSSQFEQLASISHELIAALDNGDTALATQQRVRLREIESLFDNEVHSIRTVFQEINRSAMAATRAQQQTLLRVNSIVTGLAVVVGLLYSFILTLGLVRPMHKLMEDMRRVGGGDLDVAVEVTSNDEKW